MLSLFAFVGQYIFRLFGISLPAFEIAGGVILLLIGLDMLEAKRSPTQETRKEAQAAATKDDAGIVPMGIPMLAGPGSITTVMVLVGQVQSTWEMIAILGAIAITALSCFLVLGSADRVARVLGQTGIRILVRVMGLLLVALAVQYFVNGFVDLGVIAEPPALLHQKRRARDHHADYAQHECREHVSLVPCQQRNRGQHHSNLQQRLTQIKPRGLALCVVHLSL